MSEQVRKWIRYGVDYAALVVFAAVYFLGGRDFMKATAAIVIDADCSIRQRGRHHGIVSHEPGPQSADRWPKDLFRHRSYGSSRLSCGRGRSPANRYAGARHRE